MIRSVDRHDFGLGHLVVLKLCDMEPITMNWPTRRSSVDTKAPPAATFRPDDANTWVPALRYDHTQPMHSVALQILRTAGLPHTGPFQGVWAVAIQQKELMRTVAELLSDSFISEAITHPARTVLHRAVFLVSSGFWKASPGVSPIPMQSSVWNSSGVVASTQNTLHPGMLDHAPRVLQCLRCLPPLDRDTGHFSVHSRKSPIHFYDRKTKLYPRD